MTEEKTKDEGIKKGNIREETEGNIREETECNCCSDTDCSFNSRGYGDVHSGRTAEEKGS